MAPREVLWLRARCWSSKQGVVAPSEVLLLQAKCCSFEGGVVAPKRCCVSEGVVDLREVLWLNGLRRRRDGSEAGVVAQMQVL